MGANGLLVGFALAVGVAGTAAAATLVALQATIVPGPRREAVAPEMRVLPQTARLLSLRAADPGGAPAWTLRSVRTVTGERCLTVGQRRGNTFGLVGLDGRFRALDASIVDGCTDPGGGGLELTGARVFDGAHKRDVRSVVYGLAGRDVRRVVLRAGTTSRRLTLRDGGFIALARGYPEDQPLTVSAATTSGLVRQRFGASPRLSPQTGGIPALQLSSFVIDSALTTDCVGVGPGRQTTPPQAQGGHACGRQGHPFAVVRRVVHGTAGWGELPSRTLAFGKWPADHPGLRSVTATADGRRVQARLLASRGFLAVLPANADPARVRVIVTDRAGQRTAFTRSVGLVKDPTR